MNPIHVESELHRLRPLSNKSLEFLESLLAPSFPPGARACADEARNRQLPERERKPVILRCSFDQKDTKAALMPFVDVGNVLDHGFIEARRSESPAQIEEWTSLARAALEMRVAVALPAKGRAFVLDELRKFGSAIGVDVGALVAGMLDHKNAS